MSFARVRTEPQRTERKAREQGERKSAHRKLAGSAFEATEFCNYESSVRQIEPPAMGRTSPTLRRAWPKDGPLAAICVQSVDVQCVLQFTLIHAAGCVLHRRTSRVIHRLKLFLFVRFSPSMAAASFTHRGVRASRTNGPSRDFANQIMRRVTRK